MPLNHISSNPSLNACKLQGKLNSLTLAPEAALGASISAVATSADKPPKLDVEKKVPRNEANTTAKSRLPLSSEVPHRAPSLKHSLAHAGSAILSKIVKRTAVPDEKVGYEKLAEGDSEGETSAKSAAQAHGEIALRGSGAAVAFPTQSVIGRARDLSGKELQLLQRIDDLEHENRVLQDEIDAWQDRLDRD